MNPEGPAGASATPGASAWPHGGPRLSVRFTPAVAARDAGGLAADVLAVEAGRGIVHGRRPGGGAFLVGRVGHNVAFAGSPALVRRADGRLCGLCRDEHGRIRQAGERATGSGQWTSWSVVGTGGSRFTAGPAVIVGAAGRISVFAVDADRVCWRATEDAPDGRWSAWHPVALPDGLTTDLSVAADAMATDPMAADPVADPMATDPMAADPMAADPMADPVAGVPAGGPAAPDGAVIVAAGIDGAVWLARAADPWRRLDAHVTGAPVVCAAGMRLAVLGRGDDARPWQTSVGPDGAWSTWAAIPGSAAIHADARIVAVPDAAGGLAVCVRGVYGDLRHTVAGPDGTFAPWAGEPGPVASDIGAGAGRDGAVHLVGVGADGRLVHVLRRPPPAPEDPDITTVSAGQADVDNRCHNSHTSARTAGPSGTPVPDIDPGGTS